MIDSGVELSLGSYSYTILFCYANHLRSNIGYDNLYNQFEPLKTKTITMQQIAA